MIQVGTYNYLKVKTTSADGLILSDGEQEVLLPYQQIPQKADAGEELLVFVYHHKDGRLTATSKRPLACAGDFAYLKVAGQTDDGAFMDLGIEKDLFISNKQSYALEKGRSYVVFVYVDERDGKLTGSTWLEDHVETDLTELEEGGEVNLLIFDKSELGYSAIIDNKYMGLLYRNEVYEDLNAGDTRVGYIKKIRTDTNKIDLSLRQVGFDFILDSREVILEILKENNGVLNLGDKSLPEEIRDQLKMSKKAFKQVIGGLYKQRLITMSDYEIRLTEVIPKD